MATKNSNIAANANVVSKSSTDNTAKQSVKTQRVLETRDQWTVIFNHTVSLVVALAKGESMPDDPRKGFAFGKTTEQPHSRAYAQSLIGGFVSGKAGKVLAQTEGLADKAQREKIAIAILLGSKLAKDGQEGARRILGKAEPKQAKAFATAVLSGLTATTTDPVAPKEQKTKAKKQAKSKK